MDTFEDLGLRPELCEILVAEGIERPTAFQAEALPVIRRGNNVIGGAGAGAGTLVAYGAALLDRLSSGETIEDEGEAEEENERDEAGDAASGDQGPRGLVLTPTAPAAHRLARSLARAATAVDLRVAALGSSWVLPGHADVLFATPDDLLSGVRDGRVSLAGVATLVVDQLTGVVSLGGGESLRTLAEFVPAGCQRVVIDSPTRDPGRAGARQVATDFIERHMPKAVHVPPRGVREPSSDGPARGRIHYRIVEEPREEGGLSLVAELLGSGDVRHLAVAVRTDDVAADVGDFLTLHGYTAGAPGDTSVPVWLAADELAMRGALDEMGEEVDVEVLSWDVPADIDALDRRHGAGRGGHVVVLGREMDHLRDICRRAGYRPVPAPPPPEDRVRDDLVDTVERVEAALEEEDIGAYLLLLETLFERYDPAEVAAAAVALLRKGVGVRSGGAARPPGAGDASEATAASRRNAERDAPLPGDRGTAWVRLFVSVGQKDGASPGDLVGAIAGESGVDGARVGRIEMRDTFSIVEVEDAVAERIIRALNGTTVKGRSVRADYDRAGQRKPKGGRRG